MSKHTLMGRRKKSN